MVRDFSTIFSNYKGTVLPIVAMMPNNKLFHIKLDRHTFNVPEHLLSCNKDLDDWLWSFCKANDYAFAIGGYNEYRTAYTKSDIFVTDDEPRLLHLGLDIFNKAGTAIYLPIDGYIHSYQNNGSFGDYGPTLIMQHEIDGFLFHTLYGHNSISDMTIWSNFKKNTIINAGTLIGHMGTFEENKGWASHLHFQIIIDLQGKSGDYYGVCKFSEKDWYLQNCPDPNIILQMNKLLS